MWVIRWILGAILIVFVLGFSLQNQTEMVSVQLLKWKSPMMPLYLYLYLAFGAGLLFWSLISAFSIFKVKGQLGRALRENKKLQKELDKLRNISIDEESPALPPAGLEPPLESEV